MLDDLRFAWRGFARNPVFALTAVLTLALAMGATTAVFALLDHVLLRPLAVERQAELVELAVEREDGSGTTSFSYPQYLLLRDQTPGLAGLAAYGFTEFGVSVAGGEPEFMEAFEVSGNYFDVLGVRPARGRFFTDEVERPGGELVAVISHDFWQHRLAGAGDAIGQTLLVNGQPLTVIGIAPPEFRGTIPLLQAGLWLPITARPLLRPGSDIHRPGMMHWLTFVGRLAPGADAARAQALLSGRVRALEAPDSPERFTPDGAVRSPARALTLSPLRGVPGPAVGAAFGFMALLFVTAGFVLLIAAVNITSMMLARATARARELGVRRSLGATRLRIVRQILTENVLLFVMGAGAGLLVAAWLTAGFTMLSTALTDVTGIRLDVPLGGRVLGFALATALVTGLAFGIVPALHATGSELAGTLRAGVSPLRGTRLRSGFVVAQVALSLVLLITAGLLGRALQRGLNVDPGYTAAGVAVAEFDLRPYGYDADATRLFLTQLRERLDAHGGVTVAGVSSMQPLQGWSTAGARPEGHDAGPQGGMLYQGVDGGYLRALRVPLHAGRYFDDGDRAGAPDVAIVNDAFVQRYWPGQNPIGKHIFQGPTGTEVAIEVVGVVATGKYRSLAEEPQPFFYLPVDQQRVTTAAVFARGASGTAAMQRILRDEVRALDPNVPVRTAPLGRTIDVLLTPQRIAATAIGAFGLVGLLLAGIGIYGLVAYTAAQRTREVGVRIALGAQRLPVIMMFLRQGAALLLVGSAIGLVSALAAGRLLTALLHGVSPADPLTFIVVPMLLAAVALLAAYLPARRASNTDPMAVLRSD